MLNIYNLYPSTVWVTIMWYSPGCPDGGDWEKAGWWKIEPGEGKTVFGGDLEDVNRYFCYFAHAADGVQWSGPYVRKVPHQAFDWCEWIANSNSRDVGFRLLDIGDNDDYALTLIPYGDGLRAGERR